MKASQVLSASSLSQNKSLKQFAQINSPHKEEEELIRRLQKQWDSLEYLETTS